ncbi:cell division protein FtsL [Clostridium sp. LS]|uniref:cell division protein FtsL n=1 Tax=Clostridium sp. LS TaxID=1352601 RepID=UPI0015D4B5B0|nr:cell division protein FtsL [Clostridium sp. LS]
MSWDVNKLARREYDYIKGNTVLAPERKTRIRKPDKKQIQIKKRRKIANKNIVLKNRRKNDRKYLLTVAVMVIGLGLITIYEDNKVYSMQGKVSGLTNEIKQTQEDNEALEVQILKYSSLSNIQENAKNKLAMYVPNKDETVRIDFSQNYFKDLKPKETETSTKEKNLFSRLIGFIK